MFSNRDGNAEIYVMNRDGTSQVNVTSSAADDILGGWSPDGSSIVYTSFQGGAADLYVAAADGSERQLLVGEGQSLDVDPTYDTHPTWSATGAIAFGRVDQSRRMPLSHIWRLAPAFAEGGDDED